MEKLSAAKRADLKLDITSDHMRVLLHNLSNRIIQELLSPSPNSNYPKSTSKSTPCLSTHEIPSTTQKPDRKVRSKQARRQVRNQPLYAHHHTPST